MLGARTRTRSPPLANGHPHRDPGKLPRRDIPQPPRWQKAIHTDPPTHRPTDLPTYRPTDAPTYRRTDLPTYRPTDAPTHRRTDPPTHRPTDLPTYRRTDLPTYRPTDAPTHRPTDPPTHRPDPSTASLCHCTRHLRELLQPPAVQDADSPAVALRNTVITRYPLKRPRPTASVSDNPTHINGFSRV